MINNFDRKPFLDPANTNWGREPPWEVDSFDPFNTSIGVEGSISFSQTHLGYAK